MGYVVPVDLLALGPKELAELAVHDFESPLDPGLLAATLRSEARDDWTVEEQVQADAAAERLAVLCSGIDALIDLKVGQRNALPITDAAALTVLRGHAIAIARYRCNGDRELPETSPVLIDYRDAMRYLDRLAAGQESLTAAAAPTVGWIIMSSAERVFSRDLLTGF